MPVRFARRLRSARDAVRVRYRGRRGHDRGDAEIGVLLHRGHPRRAGLPLRDRAGRQHDRVDAGGSDGAANARRGSQRADLTEPVQYASRVARRAARNHSTGQGRGSIARFLRKSIRRQAPHRRPIWATERRRSAAGHRVRRFAEYWRRRLRCAAAGPINRPGLRLATSTCRVEPGSATSQSSPGHGARSSKSPRAEADHPRAQALAPIWAKQTMRKTSEADRRKALGDKGTMPLV